MTFKQHASFCPALWTSIYTHPDGRIDSCCVGSNNLGNMHTTNIREILKSDRARSIRQQMLEGQVIPGCDACARQQRQGSLQSYFTEYYNNIDDAWYQDVDNFSLRYLDLRWNNTCNLACIYCGPECSSLWEEYARNNSKIVPIKKIRRDDKDNLFSYVMENIHTIQRVYLAGGEPLMIKENIAFLERLHEVNPNCSILVNSNITILGDNPVFTLLKKFRSVGWLISAESRGTMFEHVRWPAKWDVFYKNFAEIARLRDEIGHTIHMNMVVMNINALEIWNFIDLIHSDFGVPHSMLSLALCDNKNSASPFTIARLPPELKDRVKRRIGSGYRAVRKFDNMYAYMNEPYPADYSPLTFGLEHTIAHLNRLGRQRRLDYQTVFPDIYRYMAKYASELAHFIDQNE